MSYDVMLVFNLSFNYHRGGQANQPCNSRSVVLSEDRVSPDLSIGLQLTLVLFNSGNRLDMINFPIPSPLLRTVSLVSTCSRVGERIMSSASQVMFAVAALLPLPTDTDMQLNVA